MAAKPTEKEITRFADMFSAMGTGPRLRIMRVLLSAHPDGMIVGDIGSELGIPASTLSHHLEKLKNGFGEGEARRDVSLVLSKHGGTARAPWLSLCRMLHAKQGHKTAGDCPPVPMRGLPWNSKK
jgi:DNA-binding transcriptional ArsR family regulator